MMWKQGLGAPGITPEPAKPEKEVPEPAKPDMVVLPEKNQAVNRGGRPLTSSN